MLLMVHTVTSISGLNTLLAQKPTVVKFGAKWCGPCKSSAPGYHALADKYGANVNFVDVDVDNAQDVSGQYGVKSLPTFVYFVNKTEVKRVTGASSMNSDIVDFVQKHGKTVFEETQGHRIGGEAEPAANPNAWRDPKFIRQQKEEQKRLKQGQNGGDNTGQQDNTTENTTTAEGSDAQQQCSVI